MNFTAFPKIPRLNRECVITEKIDGTNAQVFVWDECYNTNTDKKSPLLIPAGPLPADIPAISLGEGIHVAAGSRNKWITPQDDNYGFAKWVSDHAAELVYLGHGRHFGEWWGKGIQRNYGLAEKRFSLFNVSRWKTAKRPESLDWGTATESAARILLPDCCDLVPRLYDGPFSSTSARNHVSILRALGSVAAPGFKTPEGIIIFHTAANHCFKVTLEGDEKPKSSKE
jgi:hypothetical protein